MEWQTRIIRSISIFFIVQELASDNWQVLTGLILEVRVVSVRKEPGLQVERKKNHFYYTYATSFRLHPMRRNNHATARTRLIV